MRVKDPGMMLLRRGMRERQRDAEGTDGVWSRLDDG